MHIVVDSSLATRLADRAREQGFASAQEFVDVVLRDAANADPAEVIDRMLAEAETDVRAGRVMSHEQSMANLREHLSRRASGTGEGS